MAWDELITICTQLQALLKTRLEERLAEKNFGKMTRRIDVLYVACSQVAKRARDHDIAVCVYMLSQYNLGKKRELDLVLRGTPVRAEALALHARMIDLLLGINNANHPPAPV